MTEHNKGTISVSSLQEAWTRLVRIAGTIAGATGLTFGVGFMLVNLSLLKHGVYEGALVRERYIAAGISYLTILAGAVLIARAVYSLVDRLPNRWPRPARLLVAVVLTPVLDYVLALAVWAGGRAPPKLVGERGADYVLTPAVWWLKGLRYFNVTMLIWALIAGWLALFLIHADRFDWTRKLLLREAPPTAPPPKIPETSAGPPQPASSQAGAPFLRRVESPAYLAALVILFFALLVTYGQYVYETLPAALGGGLPVVVQFTGGEDKMAILKGMGVPLENLSTTGQLELIGQTDSRYIVFIRQINWERSATGETRLASQRTALAFDKELVQGVRYYPSEYYLSDAFAAVTHTQEGDDLYSRGFYDDAIKEYDLAIARRPDYDLAYFHRGLAYLTKARNAVGQGDPGAAQVEADRAVADLETVAGLNPGKGDYWYYQAVAQALAGQHQAAVNSLREAINRDEVYGDEAQDESAFDELEVRADLNFSFEIILFGSEAEAGRAYATQGQDHYTAAQQASDEKVRHEALTRANLAYSRAISLTADLPLEQASYRVALAAIYQDQELPALALTQLERAVKAAPANEGYHLQLAHVYIEQGNLPKALDEYEAVLKHNDQNVSAWLGKGEVLRQQAQYRQAADAFHKAAELAPEEADAWYGLGVAWLAVNPAEAEEPLRRTVTLDPSKVATIRKFLEDTELEADVREQLEDVLMAAEASLQGDAALEVNDLEGAIAQYQIAVDADPDNTVYLAKLGDAYRKQGDDGALEAYTQAADIYRSLIEQDQSEPSYHFRLAIVYAAQGQDADALTSYDTAISLAPDVAAYYAARATLYVQLGRAGDAITDYEQAIDLEPSNHLYYARMGQIYYEQAQYAEAIAALTTATGLNPQYAHGFYQLGLAHLALDDADAARIAFTTCTEVTQDEIQSHQCQEQLSPLATPTP